MGVLTDGNDDSARLFSKHPLSGSMDLPHVVLGNSYTTLLSVTVTPDLEMKKLTLGTATRTAQSPTTGKWLSQD